MPTVLNRTFIFYECTNGGYGTDGKPVDESFVSRNVKGTIQPVSGEEAVSLSHGTRQTGVVKVYSSLRLASRSQESEKLGYVKSPAGRLYELTEELPYQNVGVIRHWKYVACEVPSAQIPEALA